MSAFFCDSSALVKRYISEIGSGWLLATTAPKVGNYVFVARIAYVEVISAITRRERGGHIFANDANIAITKFETDYSSEFFNVEISESLIFSASLLAKNMRCAATMPFN